MTAIDMLAAISGTKSLSVLDGLARTIWTDWADQKLTDDQAGALAETLERRKREVRGVDTVAARAPQVTAAAKAQGRPSYFPAKRKGPVRQNRRASIERRRTLAASGPMPPALACLFTTGELAVLRIVADEARDRKQCRLTLGEIAARAGVGISTARNALHYAAPTPRRQCSSIHSEARELSFRFPRKNETLDTNHNFSQAGGCAANHLPRFVVVRFLGDGEPIK